MMFYFNQTIRLSYPFPGTAGRATLSVVALLPAPGSHIFGLQCGQLQARSQGALATMFGEEDIVSKMHFFITFGEDMDEGSLIRQHCIISSPSLFVFGHLLKKYVQWGCREVGETEKLGTYLFDDIINSFGDCYDV